MLHDILLIVLGLVVGGVVAFFITKHLFQKQIKENPPINEDMIKALMRGMGRQPNQKTVNQLMKQMERYQK